MSDVRSVEAVTETLCGIVDAAVKTVAPGAGVSSRPPDQAATDLQDLRVNVFLYQTDVDPALSNVDPPDVRPGETAQPVLPLVLHYLLTPYVPDGDDLPAHRLLGAAVSALHAHSRLTRVDLEGLAPYSNVAHQVERVRITWQPFGEKDIYSMWSVFQAPYRLSVAFEVRVVVLDGRRPARAVLPVLIRGADGRGPVVVPSAATPDLLTVAYAGTAGPRVGTDPYVPRAARAGESVVLGGTRLSSATKVRITHPSIAVPVDVAPTATADTEITFTVPGGLPAGLCSAGVLIGSGLDEREIGDVFLAVAPVVGGLPQTVRRDRAQVTFDLTCSPALRPGQRVRVMVGGHAVTPVVTSPTEIACTVGGLEPGGYPVRLRVDGVDSLLDVDRRTKPPSCDSNQILRVT